MCAESSSRSPPEHRACGFASFSPARRGTRKNWQSCVRCPPATTTTTSGATRTVRAARQIKPTDWPYFGSVVKLLKPITRLPALATVWVPDVMRLNDNVTPAGQIAGFLGKQWEPERFVGDPAKPDYHIEGLDFGGGSS